MKPAVIGMLLAPFALLAQSSDSWVGTWKLDVAKSKYSPGPAPKSNTVKISPSEGGLSIVVDGIDGEGK